MINTETTEQRGDKKHEMEENDRAFPFAGQ